MRSTKRGPGEADALELSAGSGEISFTLLRCREMGETNRRSFPFILCAFCINGRINIRPGQNVQSLTRSKTVAA